MMKQQFCELCLREKEWSCRRRQRLLGLGHLISRKEKSCLHCCESGFWAPGESAGSATTSTQGSTVSEHAYAMSMVRFVVVVF